MTKDEMNKQLIQQVHSLTATVDSLNATINAQTQLIAQLNQTIQELKEQLNKNSQNSSKPPSSDGYKKPAPKSLRKPSGKKVGGQNGHPGTHLVVITAPNEIVKHMPSACEGCLHYRMCKGTACIAENDMSLMLSLQSMLRSISHWKSQSVCCTGIPAEVLFLLT